MRILILCTGNSCRSQMAEGILRSLRPGWEIFSGGTNPEKMVNPYAVRVMSELGLDISAHRPTHIEKFVNESFDYVITVCDNARENCPVFTGNVKKRLHVGFEDPAAAQGSEEEKLLFYRKVRDQIREAFTNFINQM